jgi:RNAse (barnase) inhibitor barstar
VTLIHPLSEDPDGFQPMPADPVMAAAGMQASLRTLDLSAVSDRAELMQQLYVGLDLPEHFGRNWDALFDLLADPETMRPTAVQLVGWEHFNKHHRELAAGLKNVLLDAQMALRAAGIALWLLN